MNAENSRDGTDHTNADDIDPDRSNRWANYYAMGKGRPPRPLVTELLRRASGIVDESSDEPPLAIDLGCGNGIDSVAMIAAGWRVLAIDREARAIELLNGETRESLIDAGLITPEDFSNRLETRVASFEEIADGASILPSCFSVYAGFSLPFCRPGSFSSLMAEIGAALRPGGFLAAHFFGPNDSWFGHSQMTFLSRDELLSTLAGLSIEIVDLDEVDEDGESCSGPKHWHRFDVIGRRTI